MVLFTQITKGRDIIDKPCKPVESVKIRFNIGDEVAFDMNSPYEDNEPEQGYCLHTIDGTEDDDFLNRCVIFSAETMNKLR